MSERTILIVDDDPDLRHVLQDIFEVSGYHAATAANGREALSYLHASPAPAVILLDMTMPVMNGLAFLEEIHSGAHPTWAVIPIVVLSAVQEFVSLARFGCVAILRKPAELDTLLSIAERYAPKA